MFIVKGAIDTPGSAELVPNNLSLSDLFFVHFMSYALQFFLRNANYQDTLKKTLFKVLFAHSTFNFDISEDCVTKL